MQRMLIKYVGKECKTTLHLSDISLIIESLKGPLQFGTRKYTLYLEETDPSATSHIPKLSDIFFVDNIQQKLC